MIVTTLKPLLAKNRSWALQRRQRNPDYFKKFLHQQKPHSLWIGCSDSRVPAEVLTGSQPGELFVHRNIANMVIEEDDNLLSVLQYALFFLGVKRIVLSGHYGCGGVEAALNLPGSVLDGQESALARRISRLRQDIETELAENPSPQAETADRLDRLVEANVKAQFARLVNAGPVRQIWQSGQELAVFGCVYDLRSGHLKELIHQSAEEPSL
ncbi:carbonic anhydrase [Pantoea graminicola]|uniref:carbonic anhydrase n=1 Tax=Pantoea sp. ARC607 TaxID=2027922 RepID=UPI000DAA04BA|nr:carbonic anhydrase [Pantoea sp. ARC607]PZL91773.1 carbonic anhydrase [Pantoea sp. ARC607]